MKKDGHIFRDINQTTINYSDMISTKVVNVTGQTIGKLKDFFVNYNEVYPSVAAIQYEMNNQLFYITWENIASFSTKQIVIKDGAYIGLSRAHYQINSDEKDDETDIPRDKAVSSPPLGKVVLDRQIVDTSGKKVVRVNDIKFVQSGNGLRATHACIGLRSMMRRIGYGNILDACIKLVSPNNKYLTNEISIDWKYVNAIPKNNLYSNLKINLADEDIKDIHPADIADILENLDPHGREVILETFEPKRAAKILSEVEKDLLHSFVNHLEPDKILPIIKEMSTDDAADLLHQFPQFKQEQLVQQITDDDQQEAIQELLEYDDDTAGGLMATEIFEISPKSKKSEVLNIIQKIHEELDNIYDIYIVGKEKKLIGVCPLHKLLIQEKNVVIEDIMDKGDIKYIHPDAHWREVAICMKKYNLVTIPVLDEEKKLVGVISVDDILDRLLDD